MVLADYMSTIGSGDERYSECRELLESLVFEYNIRAVQFVERDKWNCVAPYQLSTVELLYRGVRRNGNTRGTDMSSATPNLTVNANGTVVKAEKKSVAKKVEAKKPAAKKAPAKKAEKKTDFQLWSEKNAEKLKGMKPAEKLEAAFKAGVAKGKALAKASK